MIKSKRKILIICLMCVILASGIAALWRHSGLSKVPLRYLGDAISLKMANEKCDLRDKSGIIAHAGGGIIDESGTYTYTNSKEALLQSVSEGFRYIELDLMLNSEGEIFAVHDYKHFYSITNAAPSDISAPPSTESIAKSKILGHFTPLDINTINEIFLANPQTYLVTDKLNDFRVMKTQLKMGDRILVEVFGLRAYYAARKAGIRYAMLSSGDFALAKKLGIPFVAAHTSSLEGENGAKSRDFIANGGCIAIFSSNDEDFIKTHLGRSATMIYSDFWDIKNAKCKLGRENCKTY